MILLLFLFFSFPSDNYKYRKEDKITKVFPHPVSKDRNKNEKLSM